MIEFKNVVKKYGRNKVLDIPSWHIDKNEIIGLVGNNGAGKTTAFSLLLDLIKATSGEVLVKGKNVAASEDWKLYISSFLDDSFLIQFLTPDEYFQFIGSLYGIDQKSIIDFMKQYEDFFAGEIIGKRKYIRDLSKGNQKKVGLVASFIGDPEVIVLDEPFSNLDPTSQNRLKKIIIEQSHNRTVLISSHDLNHVLDICNRIVLLEKGLILKDLKKEEDTFSEIVSYFEI